MPEYMAAAAAAAAAPCTAGVPVTPLSFLASREYLPPLARRLLPKLSREQIIDVGQQSLLHYSKADIERIKLAIFSWTGKLSTSCCCEFDPK